MSAKRERPRPAKHPAISSLDALLSADASLAEVLAGLEGLEVEGLRRQWSNYLGGEAPAHLPKWLLVKVLGHRLQANAFGDLDKSVRRLLREESDGVGTRNTAPFDRRDAQTRDGIALRPGALLVREWQGKLERVMVLEEGFAWNGKNFCSLSQIAKAMTGTNWNGHRFFGLRQQSDPGNRRAIGLEKRRGRDGGRRSLVAAGAIGSRGEHLGEGVGAAVSVVSAAPIGEGS